jgi:hypothetical protein
MWHKLKLENPDIVIKVILEPLLGDAGQVHLIFH